MVWKIAVGGVAVLAAIDDRSARATMVDGETEYRPWEGRFYDYQEIEGMIVPMQGEVSWILEEGRKPYWRGTITHISYETAQ